MASMSPAAAAIASSVISEAHKHNFKQLHGKKRGKRVAEWWVPFEGWTCHGSEDKAAIQSFAPPL